jgi:hypothetical protein
MSFLSLGWYFKIDESSGVFSEVSPILIDYPSRIQLLTPLKDQITFQFSLKKKKWVQVCGFNF